MEQFSIGARRQVIWRTIRVPSRASGLCGLFSVLPGAFDPRRRARFLAALTKILADAKLLHSAGDIGPEFRDLLQRAGALLGMVIGGWEASADPTDGYCAALGYDGAMAYDVRQLDPRLAGQSEARKLH